MVGIRGAAWSIGGLLLTSCAAQTALSSAASVEAVSSTNFRLERPIVSQNGGTTRVYGTVCRAANRALMSPSRIEIDHLDATGTRVDTAYAFLPSLSRRPDQRCGHYAGTVSSRVTSTDTVRVCIARVGKVCPPGK